MKMYLKVVVLYLLFAYAITYLWRWYEIKAFGEVQPDPFHTIIAIVMALSLTANVMLYGFLKKK